MMLFVRFSTQNLQIQGLEREICMDYHTKVQYPCVVWKHLYCFSYKGEGSRITLNRV